MTVLALHALRAWRSFRSFGRATSAALADVARAGAETEAKAKTIPERTERLTRAVERLQHSLERLAILRAAADDFGRGVRGIRGAVPRK